METIDSFEKEMEIRNNISDLIDNISDLENKESILENIEYAIQMLNELKNEQ